MSAVETWSLGREVNHALVVTDLPRVAARGWL